MIIRRRDMGVRGTGRSAFHLSGGHAGRCDDGFTDHLCGSGSICGEQVLLFGGQERQEISGGCAGGVLFLVTSWLSFFHPTGAATDGGFGGARLHVLNLVMPQQAKPVELFSCSLSLAPLGFL